MGHRQGWPRPTLEAQAQFARRLIIGFGGDETNRNVWGSGGMAK